MHLVHALDSRARRFWCVERIHHVDAPQHEHLLLEFYFANGFASEPSVAGTDLARLQRAPEGAE